ncbi:M14 family metallopeptidase [Dictyobacter arantiisoli]|uniref:Peptidase M14 n=1 Tax=Dictyobacter arantiisoli TaxID=2014874 RepID=A0A5A5T9R0_9CHLR|nr:M14 family metallopeptidase [Dictyobacter arantiisoli]GCF07995.1 peptidase M14 [Dictyobacter arantiisoli]
MPGNRFPEDVQAEHNILSYYTYHELTSSLHQIVQNHPQLAHIESLGKSFEGRDLWLVTVTNYESGPANEKPAYWIDGNTHADEVMGSTVALYTLWYLLTNYEHNPSVTRLLDRSVFYILPRISVDGAEHFLTTPGSLRSSKRPYPDSNKLREGLQVEDIDGDGNILTMRIKDPNGAWKCSAKDPRVMRRREIDEEDGEYYHLLPEGHLYNYDEFFLPIAQETYGIDFNRNYPFEWAPEGTQQGAGTYPLSEPETRAEVEFWHTHPNISAFLTYHTAGGIVLRPYSTRPDTTVPLHDLEVFNRMGERATQITGYPCFSTYHDFRESREEITHGGMDDYVYDTFGWFGFTVELWDMLAAANITGQHPLLWQQQHPEEDDIKLMKWNDEGMNGEVFQEWKAFNHPQLGQIEIGGWKTKFSVRNAPPRYLREICLKMVRLTLSHASLLPYLRFHTVKVTSVRQTLFRVIAVVENAGFLPTYTSRKALENNAVEEVNVSLSLPEDVYVLAGKQHQKIGHIEGRSNKLRSEFNHHHSPTDNRRKVEWVLEGMPGTPIDIIVRSPRAGTLHHTFTLPDTKGA